MHHCTSLSWYFVNTDPTTQQLRADHIVILCWATITTNIHQCAKNHEANIGRGSRQAATPSPLNLPLSVIIPFFLPNACGKYFKWSRIIWHLTLIITDARTRSLSHGQPQNRKPPAAIIAGEGAKMHHYREDTARALQIVRVMKTSRMPHVLTWQYKEIRRLNGR